MDYKVKYSSLAKTDLAGILDYLCDDANNCTYASKLLDKLDSTTARLASFPEMYQIMSGLDGAKTDFRLAPVNGYAAIYYVNHENREVIIARIFSCRCDYKKLL